MRTLVIVGECNEANRNLISAKCWIASLTARDDDRGRRRRHCEERELRSNPSGTLFGPAMDCFVEPVIGRAFARPVGSQWREDRGSSLQWQWRA